MNSMRVLLKYKKPFSRILSGRKKGKPFICKPYLYKYNTKGYGFQVFPIKKWKRKWRKRKAKFYPLYEIYKKRVDKKGFLQYNTKLRVFAFLPVFLGLAYRLFRVRSRGVWDGTESEGESLKTEMEKEGLLWKEPTSLRSCTDRKFTDFVPEWAPEMVVRS